MLIEFIAKSSLMMFDLMQVIKVGYRYLSDFKQKSMKYT